MFLLLVSVFFKNNKNEMVSQICDYHLSIFFSLDPFRLGLSNVKPSKILRQFSTNIRIAEASFQTQMIKKEKCMKSGILCQSYKLRKFTQGENWLNKKFNRRISEMLFMYWCRENKTMDGGRTYTTYRMCRMV